jgi:hypothetical protein
LHVFLVELTAYLINILYINEAPIQNTQVLLDSLKRKTYDDELRREELLNYFRRFQSASQKKGGSGIFRQGFSPSEGVDEGPYGLSRRIACKKCGDFHLWIYTGRAKSQARWCQVFSFGMWLFLLLIPCFKSVMKLLCFLHHRTAMIFTKLKMGMDGLSSLFNQFYLGCCTR